MTGNYTPEFRVANLAARAMNSFMAQTFTGSGGINSTSSGSAFSSDVIQALYSTEDYPGTIKNLAASMTKNIRQQNDSNFGPFKGIAFQGQTYVHRSMGMAFISCDSRSPDFDASYRPHC